VPFRHRAAIDGEILAEDIDEAAVDRTRSGDDAVARNMLFVHAEIDAVMLDIHVQLFKAVLVQQHFDPLPRGQLALAMLRVDAALAAAHAGTLALGFQLFDDGELRHERLLSKFAASIAWPTPPCPSPTQPHTKFANVNLPICKSRLRKLG